MFTSNQAPHRAALILFSDGEDDLSLHDLSDAITEAEVTGVAIYTVSAHNPKTRAPGDAVLHDLAVHTGGRDFVAKDANQLQEALAAIDGELRTSYLLYYRPRRIPENMASAGSTCSRRGAMGRKCARGQGTSQLHKRRTSHTRRCALHFSGLTPFSFRECSLGYFRHCRCPGNASTRIVRCKEHREFRRCKRIYPIRSGHSRCRFCW